MLFIPLKREKEFDTFRNSCKKGNDELFLDDIHDIGIVGDGREPFHGSQIA